MGEYFLLIDLDLWGEAHEKKHLKPMVEFHGKICDGRR